jgi:RNA polymerase sigma factor (sigma-70 family)
VPLSQTDHFENHGDFSQVLNLLARARAGDGAAWNELLRFIDARLRRQVQRQLHGNPLRRWEETDDVLSVVQTRLWTQLQHWTPRSDAEFFADSAKIIRNHLIDLARHHFGPNGDAAHHQTRPPQASTDFDPLEQSPAAPAARDWGEFHGFIENLPHEIRRVFELIFYMGMQRPQVAQLLGISVRTVFTRWMAAKELIASHFK